MTSTLETVAYRAPLALRVTDASTGGAVADGLVATAWPAGDPTAARTARKSTISELLGFGTLPGLRSLELAAAKGDNRPTFPPVQRRPFVVRVLDTFARFLPQLITVDVPRSSALDVALFSAPGRPRLPGWATVSGEVHVSGNGAATAWAVIRLDDGASTFDAVTDEAGRFLIYLPYPEALPPLAGNPPPAGGIGLVSWPLTCTVRAEPAALLWPVPEGPGVPPEISSIRGQAAAQISTGAGSQPSVTATLQFGTPLLLPLQVVPA